MQEAVPLLVWMALLFFSFAVVWSVRQFVSALLGPLITILNSIPLFGGVSADLLLHVENAISNNLGRVEHGIDGLIGASFHRFAELNLWLWREIKSHALLVAEIAAGMVPISEALAGLRSLVHNSVHANTGTNAKVKQLEREFNGIEHQVKALERELGKGIGHDLRIHIKALETELGHIEHVTIPAITHADTQAANAISDLYSWAKGKASLLGIGTLATAVGAVVATLGNGWLGCRNNPFSNSKDPCGLWGDLARFLPLLGFLALAFDFEAFVTAADEVASAIGPSVASIEGSIVSPLAPLPPPN